MAWYAYCITEQKVFNAGVRVRKPFPIEGVTGVDGAQVIGYPSGDFAVIVTEYLKSGTLEQQAALEHAHVISECFKYGPVLPFKFATVFENEEAIRQTVRSNRKAFARSITELRGKAEMHIKVVVRSSTLPHYSESDCELPAAVGVEYLSKLRIKATQERETQTRVRSLSQQVNKLLNPLDEEITCKRGDAGTLMIGIAHLIDNESISKYQHRFQNATRHFKDYDLVLSGPWPPYHFLPGKLRLVRDN